MATTRGRPPAAKTRAISNTIEHNDDTEATWTIRCETRGTDVFDRYAGVMSLFHFLSTGVVVKAGGRGRKRLAKIEELHEDFHQFS